MRYCCCWPCCWPPLWGCRPFPPTPPVPPSPPPEPSSGYVSFTKVNAGTGAPLAGVSFSLIQNGAVVGTAVSGADGLVDLGRFAPGSYTLVETGTPAGFIPLSPATVVIGNDGSVSINGLPSSVHITNTPLYAVDFLKVNVEGFPLTGAQFTLRQNNMVIRTALSDVNGLVDFGTVLPGSYILTETVSPPGYLPLPPMRVVVGGDGSVTINGLPASIPLVNEREDDELPPNPN